MSYEFPSPTKNLKNSIKTFLKVLKGAVDRADSHSALSAYIHAPDLTDEDLTYIAENLLLVGWTTATLTRSQTTPSAIQVELTKDWNSDPEEES